MKNHILKLEDFEGFSAAVTIAAQGDKCSAKRLVVVIVPHRGIVTYEVQVEDHSSTLRSSTEYFDEAMDRYNKINICG